MRAEAAGVPRRPKEVLSTPWDEPSAGPAGPLGKTGRHLLLQLAESGS